MQNQKKVAVESKEVFMKNKIGRQKQSTRKGRYFIYLFIKKEMFFTAGYAPILIKSSSLRKVVFALLNFMLCE